jgi:hypothetical protein
MHWHNRPIHFDFFAIGWVCAIELAVSGGRFARQRA